MVYVNNSNELYHYGVKGMRWGHRKAAYQNTVARTGNSAQRQAYLNAKANKKAAGKAYSKAYSKAYNKSLAAYSPFKKHRQANDERWNDAIQKAKDMNAADKAYKDAKKAYKQTDEYKAKRAKAIKVGVAVAGTALAAYGAYKVSNIIKDKATSKAYAAGQDAAKRWLAAGRAAAKSGNGDMANTFFSTAGEVQKRANDTASRVGSSTVEAAKYLYNTRKR